MATAKEALDLRLAKGEISATEYDQLLGRISEQTAPQQLKDQEWVKENPLNYIVSFIVLTTISLFLKDKGGFLSFLSVVTLILGILIAAVAIYFIFGGKRPKTESD